MDNTTHHETFEQRAHQTNGTSSTLCRKVNLKKKGRSYSGYCAEFLFFFRPLKLFSEENSL